MTVEIEKRLITVEEYHKMAEVGILTADDRVELLNGEIYTMSPVTSLHAGHVKRLNRILTFLLQDKAIIGVQDPVEISGFSEPEPDLSILHFREDIYTESHPVPSEVYLIIEVSLSTLAKDKRIKTPLYASANIPEYWIVNLEDEQIEVYRQPMGNQYMDEKIYRRGDSIIWENFKLTIKVEEILG